MTFSQMVKGVHGGSKVENPCHIYYVGRMKGYLSLKTKDQMLEF